MKLEIYYNDDNHELCIADAAGIVANLECDTYGKTEEEKKELANLFVNAPYFESYTDYVQAKIDIDEMPLRFEDWRLLEDEAHKEFNETSAKEIYNIILPKEFSNF